MCTKGQGQEPISDQWIPPHPLARRETSLDHQHTATPEDMAKGGHHGGKEEENKSSGRANAEVKIQEHWGVGCLSQSFILAALSKQSWHQTLVATSKKTSGKLNMVREWANVFALRRFESPRQGVGKEHAIQQGDFTNAQRRIDGKLGDVVLLNHGELARRSRRYGMVLDSDGWLVPAQAAVTSTKPARSTMDTTDSESSLYNPNLCAHDPSARPVTSASKRSRSPASGERPASQKKRSQNVADHRELDEGATSFLSAENMSVTKGTRESSTEYNGRARASAAQSKTT